jgi:amino acid adenylation domain-containing protein/non-ribosomal peptide synthase protein (TIGR01720 family)
MSQKNIEDIYPLSPLQQGILFHTLYASEPGTYFVQLGFSLRGPLDVPALVDCFQQVVDRNPILRSAFVWERLEKPMQIVRERAKLPVEQIDLRALSAAEQAAAIGRYRESDRRKGFDLTRAPLLRLAVFRLADDDHAIVWSRHHLILDGWSLPLVLKELFTLYQARVTGSAEKPERGRPYGEYIEWLGQQDLAAAEVYFRAALRGFTAPTPLPADRPGALSDASIDDRQLELSEAESAALQALARRQQLTINTLVQGAWAILLARSSAEEDVVFGVTVSGRSAPVAGIERMVGVFLNTLPVRAEVKPGESALSFLRALQDRQAELREHEQTPLIEVQGWSELPRGTGLFDSLVVFENYPVDQSLWEGAGGLRVAEVWSSSRATYPLTLVATFQKTLLLRLDHDRGRFDADTADRLLAQLRSLLLGLVEAPERTIAELPLLSLEEKQRVLVAWNATDVAYPEGTLLHQLVEAQVETSPDAVAVRFEGQSLSYRALDEQANRLAHRLQRAGVGPDVRVAVCLDRSIELVVALLAVLKAGGAYVPVDPSYPRDRVDFMIADAGAPVLLTQERHRGSLSGTPAEILALDTLDTSAESDEAPPCAATAESLAYVLYTSGSTGTPKGAMIPHRAIVNHMRWMAATWPLDATDAVLQKTPISFDASVWEFYAPLMSGARLVMARPEGHRDAAYLVSTLADERITVLQLVPSLLELLLQEPGLERAVWLKRLYCGGEALHRALVERFWARLPEPQVVNLYGPTEAAIDSTYWVSERVSSGRTMEPIGWPIANMRVYVLDTAMAPVPVGVPGELFLGGAGVGRGYLHRPELTAERFLQNPFGQGLLYRTGDLVRRLSSGAIDYLGRVDSQVKLRGFRIELGEIEAVMVAHPGVQDALCLIREDTPGDKRLVAYLVARAAAPSPAELRALCKGKLPDYMVPTAYVTLGEWPRLGSGKIDRRALPAPEAGAVAERQYIAPRGPVEEAIAAIFAEVLKTTPVGAHDSFFELGGHSLLATQAGARLRAAFGLDLPLRALFEAPTPALLAPRLTAALQAGRGVSAPPLLRAERGAETPLSFAQERLWYLDQLEPGDVAYVVSLALRLEGPLDRAALERALQEIVRRHEVLRTTFVSASGKAVQVIHPEMTIALPVTSLTEVDGEAQERRLRSELAAESGRSFDLATGPLCRARLFALAPERHVLSLSIHHIVSDAWSAGVVSRELAALYEAFSQGRPSPLPDLPLQYADHALWQRQWLSGDALEQQLSYWRSALAGAPPAIDLPTDRPRPPARIGRGARCPIFVPAQLIKALEDLARREGATLYMTLLAALDLLLYRYSGQGDIVVGSPIAGRTQAETEQLVGFFINTLVLRTELSDDLTFRELLARVKEVCLGAYAHQDMPFERLVQELAPERDTGRSPLFQVYFNLQNNPREAISLAGLRIEPLKGETSTSKFDLTFITSQGPEGLQGTLTYNNDIFDPATIERLLGHFGVLLAQIVKAPQKRLGELSLLGDDEQSRLLVEWNQTAQSYPSDECVHELFESVVDRTPEALALVAGADRLSYRELDQRANRLAHHLRRQGVGPDVVVGICLDRSADLVIALLGVLKAGGAYLPLDPSYPPARLAQILEEAESRVVVTHAAFQGALPAEGVALVRLDHDGAALAAESDARPEREISAQNLCYLLFTSGSTGRPKGVAIEHLQLTNYIHGVAERMALPEGASYAHVSTFAADLGNTVLFPPLCLGGTLHVISHDLTTDPEGLASYFAEHSIDCLKIVPSHLSALLAAAHPERVIPRKLLILGGEASSWELIERIESLSPTVRILNHYGPTETTVGVLTFPVERGQRKPGAPIVPLGRPLPNSRIYLLDAGKQPTPIGVPGEVYIGGAGVARGYLNRPELTDERFITDPFSEEWGARLYRTGDRARYLADGTLLFLGRIDHQVKIRGYRIELGEVESALAAHPGLKEAVVLAQTDPGFGALRLVAYVVPRVAPGPSDLGPFLAQRLPEYMVPSAFVALASLPLTPNGKIDRRALLALGAAPEKASSYAAPRTPVEEVLANIWADVFGKERIGVDESFVELGGHSLLAIQIIARARDAFQAQVPLRAIFEAPTIAALAGRVEAAIREGEGLEAPPITAVPPGAELQLSFAQERLWFLDQLEPGNAFYNVPLGLRLSGHLDLPALTRALREVIRRHEVLRTCFPTIEGRPVPRILPDVPLLVPIDDLSTLPEAERESIAHQEAEIEARTPFDLAQGPLIRARVLRLADTEHALLLTMHHIVTDAWTRGILGREVAALYAAFLRGRPSPLPPLPIQYADYAVWQRSWLRDEVLEKHFAYWKSELGGLSAALELPTDRPRPPVMSHRGGRRHLTLSRELSRALEALSRREGATLFMTLLAALDVLLYRHAGQSDLAVGTPITNRARAETEGLIGFFLNTLVLRAQIDGSQTFVELLARVRETCLAAYAHQDMPFERLVQELEPQRDLSRSPLFQVLFTLQSAPTEAIELPGLTLRGRAQEADTAKFDLTFVLTEGSEGIAGSLEYNADIFDASTIDRLLAHFAVLLQRVSENADLRIDDIDILPPAERHQLLVTWNETAGPYPDQALLHELVEAQAARTPDAVAVTFRGEQLSYRELDERSNRLAHHLRKLSVGPDVPVAFCLERSLALIVGILGILKAGGPVVSLDPEYPRERLTFMVDDAQAPVILGQSSLLSALPPHAATVILMDQSPAVFDAEPASHLDRGALTPDNLAYLIYTSGSTGKPKGVAMGHRPLVNLFDWGNGVSPGNVRTLQFASPSFDVSYQEIFTTLSAGGTLVLVAEDVRRDGERLLRHLASEQVERLFCPPVALMAIADADPPADLPPMRLKEIITAGEALRITPRVAALLERLPDCVLRNQYGPSESHVVTELCLRGSPRAFPALPAIGRPIRNVRCYILDSQRRPVPLGVPGELYLGGFQLARGYLHRPDLTEERFVPDPFGDEPGARLYRTGDLCRYRIDGEIDYLGRADTQVKVRGFRVELGEIEAVLGEHAAVREVVVVVREDQPGERRLVAYLVRNEGEPLAVTELRAFVKSQLPDYMIPQLFVVLEQLPLTPSGKVDRRALPAPDEGALADQARVAPRGPVEEALAGIFAEILRLPVEQVGAHDGFFELGGHSLLGTQVVSRIRSAFRIELPLRALFELPTPAGLAAQVDHALRAGQGLDLPPLTRASREAPLPLSFAQERLWFLNQLEPDDPSYVIPLGLRLRGPLDRQALARTLAALCERHETIRTNFTTLDGKPVQVIRARMDIPLQLTSLTSFPAGEREAEARRLAQLELQRPFDLASEPMLRAHLYALGEGDHALLLALHHIIGDAWTLGVLNRELAALYASFLAGKPSPLPELSIQYADYAAWQRGWLQGEALERQLAYWRTQLEGAPRALDLPTDRPRPGLQTHHGARTALLLGKDLSRAVAELSRREGVTPFMTLLAAFDALLYRVTGQNDLLVGTPIANRTEAETEKLIGFFINSLVLRAELADDLPFSDLLHRVRETCLGAYAHQDMPFERLVQELEPERDLSRSPLFQVVFTFQNAPIGSTALEGLSVERMGAVGGSAKFDLLLTMTEGQEGLLASFEYNTDLFDASTIERLARHFRALLEGAVRAPGETLAALPLISLEERQTLLVDWNRTAAPYPAEATLHGLFEARAAETPEAVALCFEGREVVYREISEQANRLAHHLLSLGAGKGVTVGICIERSPAMIVALLAVLKTGAAYVPLDPTYPRERLGVMIEISGLSILVTQAALVPALPEHQGRVVLIDDPAAFTACSAESPAVAVDPWDTAYVMYTSGSTGAPKGVMGTHTGMVNRCCWMWKAYPFQPGEVCCQKTTLSFGDSIWEIFGPLLQGVPAVLFPDATVKDLGRFVRALAEHRISRLVLVPSLLRALLDTHDDLAARLPDLHTWTTSGEALSAELCERFLASLPGRRLLNLYGCSEVSADATCFVPSEAPFGQRVPIGKPLENVQMYVLDRRMSPVPVGVSGELYVGGVGIARGYLHRPDLSAERFLPDPFLPGPRALLFRTGDLGRYLPSGDIEYLGRADQQVKIRGFRIELGEVEVALAAHPAVKQVIVAARDYEGGDRRLVAYVVPAAEPPSVAALRAFLKDRLPEYMVPQIIVLLAQLPLTPSGKVDRRRLPAPEASASVARNYVAPRGPTEEALASLFAELLHAPQVGAHDGFFELGGHSLLATQAIARIRDSFGVELPLRALFEAPAPAELALRIMAAREGAQTALLPPIFRVPREAPIRLSFAQERMWFIDQLEPNNPFYNMLSAVRLTGKLDAAVLERALQEVVRRHEALRTTFDTVEGTPVQRIHETVNMALPLVDLRALPASEREAAVKRAGGIEAQKPFDLHKGPILRPSLFQLDDEDHVLLLSMHHAVADVWALGVFRSELASLYVAFREGKPSPLPELPVQYADYSVWQRQWLAGPVFDEQMAYWKKQLAGIPKLLEMPLDRPRPPVQSHRGEMRLFELSPERTAALKELSRKEGVTLFTTLLSALSVLLHRHAGQSDIVFGSPIANRTRTETEGMIGLFINTLVLRCDLAGTPTFRELLARVKETCLGAYAHQDMPFERLVQELDEGRDMSRAPLFQVIFNLQNAPREAIDLPGLTLRGMPSENTTAKCDLTFIMSESQGRMGGLLLYATDLFEPATIDRLLGGFQILLEGISRSPGMKIDELPLLSADETRLLLVDWNRSEDPAPPAPSVQALFEAHAGQHPDAPALRFEEKLLSYRALNERANRLAHRLRALGVGPDSVVGLCVERSLEMVIGLLAVLKAGGAYLPLDPAYPRDRLAFMIEDAKVAALLTTSEFAAAVPDQGVPVVHLDGGVTLDPTLSAEDPPLDGLLPSHLAYVIYTSGSTGKPKGVGIEHRQLLNYLHGIKGRLALPEGASYALLSTFAADLGNTVLFPALCHGGTLHVISPALGQSPDDLAAYFQRHGIDCLKIVPSHLSALLSTARPAEVLPRRCLVLGGEASSWELVDTLEKLAPGCRIMNHYGPTETTIGVLTYPVERGNRPPGAPIVPLGRPLANSRIYLLDPGGRPTPLGVPGEVYIGGLGVSRGYLHRPELTAERFVPDLFSSDPGARLYRTGDRARYLPGGAILFLGRIDQQVKIRGYRIELGEIDAALTTHPALKEAVTLAREDEPGDRRLVAYVVLAGAETVSPTELRQHLEGRLPDYMVPAVFVTLSALPLTPNGKIDRRALPAPEQKEQKAGDSEPRTAVEKLLCEIWAQVMGVEKVGIHDNFFEHGGDSILNIQIVARARQAGLQITPKHIFLHPTIAELAEVAGEIESSEAEQGVVTGSVPLTPIQQLWTEIGLAVPNHWNQGVFLEVAERLDPVVLERVIDHLMEQHDTLRLRLRKVDSGWEQELADPGGPTPLQKIDLHETPDADLIAAIESATAAAQASLDLDLGPVLRVVLFDLGPDRPNRLLLVVHHLAVDGVSWRILLDDLWTAYQQKRRGDSIDLPDKTTSFKRWAEKLVEYAQGPELDAEKPYWLSPQRSTIPAVPVDLRRGENSEGSIKPVIVALDEEQTEQLLRKVPEIYGTQINDVLLTAFAQAVAPWTGSSAVLLDLEGHGREELFEDVDITRTVGWFTAVYPIVLDPGAESPPGEALKAVKEQLRAVPQRGVGYGLLRYLRDDEALRAELAAMPRPEMNFNYLGQLDQALPESSPFRRARESGGHAMSPKNRRRHLINVVASVTSGKLSVRWFYSEARHRRSTIEAVAEAFLAALQGLIAHCLSPEAGGYTPSDFQKAKLGQDDITLLTTLDLEEQS